MDLQVTVSGKKDYILALEQQIRAKVENENVYQYAVSVRSENALRKERPYG